MPEPKDPKMYERIKKKYQADMPNSAYRSGLIVKAYKAAYKKKYGDDAAYVGAKPAKSKPGLKRWFAEEWRNETGTIGYDKKNKIYRPTKRVTKKTPATWSELTPAQIKAAKKKKVTTGRVDKFKKASK